MLHNSDDITEARWHPNALNMNIWTLLIQVMA